MEKTISYKTSIDIQRRGYVALLKELGVVDFIRFIQEFEKGEGNYTEDRHQWQDGFSVREIVKKIKEEKI